MTKEQTKLHIEASAKEACRAEKYKEALEAIVNRLEASNSHISVVKVIVIARKALSE